ncbi:ATP-binding protein [Jeongeupia wiesaeckerbachi]|uniref:sensor histidine kinase n=1 Tax=Jeongeupia wiesaeckerbachi TaxID=3051218 RepID=UPI003D80137D
MNKLRQSFTVFQGWLGRRLLLAFAALILLFLLIGGVGVLATQLQGWRMEAIVDDSVPTIVESTRLEQEAIRLQRLARQLVEASNLTELAIGERQLDTSLERMTRASRQLATWLPEQAAPLVQQLEVSQRSAERLADAAQQRQAALSALRMTRMKLDWLHSDLDSELRHQSDEVLQQLQAAGPQHATAELARHAALLGKIATHERDFAARLFKLTEPNQPQPPLPRLAQLQQQLLALSAQTRQLPNPDGLPPLMQALLDNTAADGPFAQALTGFNDAEQLTRQRLQDLEQQLRQQTALAQALSGEANTSARQRLAQSVKDSVLTRWLVLITGAVALGVMLWLLFVLLGDRLFGRMALLGQNIHALTAGQYILPRRIGGRDEIGRLGHQLETLAEQMMVLERTNALALIEQTDAALLICSDDAHVLSINQAAKRLYPALATGRALAPLLPAETLQQFTALDTGQTLDVVLPHGDPASERYVRLLARCFVQDGKERRMVTLLDVSDQMRSARWLEKMVGEKTAELDQINIALRREIDERKRTQDSLLQATKFAVLGQTTTSLAHELNQPLAALVNYQFLARRLPSAQGDAELAELLQQSNQVLDRMARLIRSYRTIGRAAPPSPTLNAVDISQVVLDVAELLRGRIRKQGVDLTLDCPPGVLVNGEIVRLEQIVLNLMGNALDALQDHADPRLDVQLFVTPERVALLISDNGAGLPLDQSDDIFQPFFTTKSDGLGLGLSICRTLADECRSEIRPACALAGGAMFVLSMETHHAD